MLARFFLLLVLTFFAELWLLLWFSDRFGWQVALGEVLFSGVLGVLVMRWQNVKFFRQVRSQLSSGEAPTATVLHGMLIWMAGIFLILPGLLTDVLGLLLLVPLFRKLLGLSVALWLHRRFRKAGLGTGNFADLQHDSQLPEHQKSRIIDVKVIERPPIDSPSDSPGEG